MPVRIPLLHGARIILANLRRKLQDPAWVQERLMKGVGAIVLGSAQRAFREQRLGDIEWKHRYPNQSDPVINIAGVLADFLEGKRQPPDRRFDRRPAGMDRGNLLRSLTPGRAVTAQGFAVTVGSVQPYANLIQSGGQSTQPVTDEAKKRLGEWMKQERKKFKQKKKAFLSFGTYGRGEKKHMIGVREIGRAKNRQDAIAKLGFLFRRSELTTQVTARPFLGITDQGEREIIFHIEETLIREGTKGQVRIVKGRG